MLTDVLAAQTCCRRVVRSGATAGAPTPPTSMAGECFRSLLLGCKAKHDHLTHSADADRPLLPPTPAPARLMHAHLCVLYVCVWRRFKIVRGGAYDPGSCFWAVPEFTYAD